MAVAWPPEAARRLGRGDERDELLQIELQTRCYRRATEEQQKGRFGGPKGESERPRVCDHGAKLHTTLLPARRLDLDSTGDVSCAGSGGARAEGVSGTFLHCVKDAPRERRRRSLGRTERCRNSVQFVRRVGTCNVDRAYCSVAVSSFSFHDAMTTRPPPAQPRRNPKTARSPRY